MWQHQCAWELSPRRDALPFSYSEVCWPELYWVLWLTSVLYLSRSLYTRKRTHFYRVLSKGLHTFTKVVHGTHEPNQSGLSKKIEMQVNTYRISLIIASLGHHQCWNKYCYIVCDSSETPSCNLELVHILFRTACKGHCPCPGSAFKLLCIQAWNYEFIHVVQWNVTRWSLRPNISMLAKFSVFSWSKHSIKRKQHCWYQMVSSVCDHQFYELR